MRLVVDLWPVRVRLEKGECIVPRHSVDDIRRAFEGMQRLDEQRRNSGQDSAGDSPAA